MIIASGRNKGRRLIRMVAMEIEKHGFAEVAILSRNGLQKMNNAAQALANVTRLHVNATPEEREVDLGGGRFKLAVVVKLELERVEVNNG